MDCIKCLLLALILIACNRNEATELGKVQDCENGSSFSLREQSCLSLWGYETESDLDGFERLRIFNGLTVPKIINGQSPFIVQVAYDFSSSSTLEVAMKRVEYGQVGSETFTDTQRITIDAGRGIMSLILHPSKQIIPGSAVSFVGGKWSQDSGYIIEVKGGDRFEDNDIDGFAALRYAGIQVVAEQHDDTSAKQLILGELNGPSEITGCELVNVTLNVKKLKFKANFSLGLKQPGRKWAPWGEQIVKKEVGFQGVVAFQFIAKNQDQSCAPSGSPAIAPDAKGEWAQTDAYLLQLKISDADHPERNIDSANRDYSIEKLALPVTVFGIPSTNPPPPADDSSSMQMIAGKLSGPSEIRGCELITATLELKKLAFPAYFILALKQPGNGWVSWGEQIVRKEAGYQGLLTFQFTAANQQGVCAPPGPPAKSVDGKWPSANAYLIQLDIYPDDNSGNKLEQSNPMVIYPENSAPISVDLALSHSPTDSPDPAQRSDSRQLIP